MNVKKLLLIPLTFLAFSCAPTVTPNTDSIPTPPPKTESVMPHLEKVREGIVKTTVENAKLAEKAKQQESTIIEQKVKIVEAIVQAKRIEEKAKAKELISEIEAAELTTKLEEVEEENKKLKDSNKGFSENVRFQLDILELTRQDARATSNTLKQAEEELAGLRKQNGEMATDLANKNGTIDKISKENSKLNKALASASVYKNWIIAGVSLVGLYFLAKFLIPLIWPASRIRL